MKNNRIVPTGLKGREVMNRIKDLMKLTPINESVASSSSVELTKIGPDNKTYAIVREGHEYYIKLANKTENIVNEDFKYIGGLANKKDYAFPTYAKAIKYLNGKFISICEALDIKSDINVFRNDNLVENKATASGFGDFPKGGGFSGEGNLEGNKELAIESEEEIPANPEDYKKQPGYIGVTESKMFGSFDDEDGWYDNDDKKVQSGFDYDTEEEFHNYSSLLKKYGNNLPWFKKDKNGEKRFKVTKDTFGNKPFRVRTSNNPEDSSNQIDLALESRIMSIASSIEKIDEAIDSVLKKKV